LRALGIAIAEVKARLTQPANGKGLYLMPSIKDAENAGGEIPPDILGRMRHLIDKLARAFLANAAAAEIIAWCLTLVARGDGRVDMGIDARGGIGAAVGGNAIDQA
jgi:hypothetical protein